MKEKTLDGLRVLRRAAPPRTNGGFPPLRLSSSRGIASGRG
nr:hypothetical protein [Candidatus Freyrarchaeum guaymaensis]